MVTVQDRHSHQPPLLWEEIYNQWQMRRTQQEMFRTDVKNRNYNFDMLIMMDSGDKDFHETMDYMHFQFQKDTTTHRDDLEKKSLCDFQVALLQQLFFAFVYPQFKNDIRFATVTHGQVFRWDGVKYKCIDESPELHVLFESVVVDAAKQELKKAFQSVLDCFGYVTETDH